MMARAVSNPILEGNKTLLGRARFDYRVSDRNVLFASLETFQQNNNAYVRAPLSRNRFTVGIEISLSGETERRRDCIDAVLLKDPHITPGPLWGNFGSRDKRRGNTVTTLGHCRSRQLRIDRRRRSHIGRWVLRACLSSGIL